MRNKIACLWLCLLLVTSAGYADNPFEDKEVTDVVSTKESSLETATLDANEDSSVDSDAAKYEKWLLDGKASDTAKIASDTKDVANENKTTEYTVQPGDYLIKIAQNMLGDGSRWRELVDLNKDKYPSLLSNPNLIYAGWVLTLPGGSSSSSTTTNTGTNTSSSTGTQAVAPSVDDSSKVASGKAPKYAVDTPSGAPALKTQSAPTGSAVNTKSAEFKSWMDSALAAYGDWNMPVVKNKYGQTISVEMYMKGIMYIETGGTHRKSNGSLVTSYCGAQGFMQLMPATAKELGVDATDPKQNIAGGCKLFQKMFSGNYGSAGTKTGVDKLMLVACSYNAGPWSSLVKGSWQDLKNTGSSVQSYGIKLKMCLGLELTSDERAYAQSKMTGGQNVDSYAANCYANAQGYGL